MSRPSCLSFMRLGSLSTVHYYCEVLLGALHVQGSDVARGV